MDKNINCLPLVSVLMPVYNSDKYVKQAIDSILQQSYKEFELIIVNDGSKDNSLSIIKSYNDQRIKLISNPENKGLIYCLNFGITQCKGKYIARMDADDISLPERLQEQVKYMELNPNVGVCGCDYIQFKNATEKRHKADVDYDTILSYMIFNCSIVHPSLIIRKSVLESLDTVFNMDFKHAEDYELWSRLIFETKFSAVSKVLFKYRLHEQQVTEVNKQAQIKTANLVRKIFLQKIGFNFSDDELLTHYKIGSSQLLHTENDLYKAEAWLSNLMLQNEKQCFIAKPIFNFIIGKQWFDVCGNTNLGLKAYFYYSKSDLKGKYKANYIMLFAKCIIRSFKK